MRLKNGTLTKLSKITRLPIQVLSDYAGTSKRPGRVRAVMLEKSAKKIGAEIPAILWLYGTAKQIKAELNKINGLKN